MKQLEDIHGIQRTCYSKSSRAGEQFIKEHGLSYIVAGEMEAYDGHTKHFYRKGDIILYRKNTLIRFVKFPANDVAFEALSVILDESLLQRFAQDNKIVSKKVVKESVFQLQEDELISAYFTALQPWFGNKMNEAITLLKKQELIHLLLRHNPKFQDVLFHFGTPGKINLEAFMNENFRFNVPMSQMAFLTGRSLATFKRDFEKIFQTSPSRWLQQKRLDEAYYLLQNKQMKPKDVYMEVGFETLPHFSFAFKNKFGVNPSTL